MNSNLKNQIREFFGTPYDPEAGMGANNSSLWLDMYRGEYHYLVPGETESLNLASGIASELARLVTLEMESKLEDEDLARDYEKVIDRARVFTEYGLALGDLVLKPYPAGGKIAVDYVTPDMFLPLAFDSNDRITHIGFIDQLIKQEGEKRKQKTVYYVKVEEHLLEGGLYTITNHAFKSEKAGVLGDPISLESVEDWADIDPKLEVPGIDFPLYGHFRNPAPNNLDLKSPLGISCFSRATSLIQDADEQYSRILWEFEGSELAVDADTTLLTMSGNMPKHGDRLFRNLGLDQQGDAFYKVFSPTIRDSSLFNGLNQILRRIEFTCALAYGTLSDPNNTDKTAEEIKASKQRSFSTVVDIQNSLERALIELVRAMRAWPLIETAWAEDKPVKVPEEDPKISFYWDDSLVVDSAQDRQLMLQEVAAGLVSPEYYIMTQYGVPKEQLKNIMPSMDPATRTDYGEE